MSITLSICIPTYKRVDFLRLCLERIFTQIAGRPDIEVVVSNNASGDGTKELLAELSDKHPSLRAINRPETMSASDHYIATLMQGRGRWCVYLADDDFVDVATIVDLIRTAEADPEIVAIYTDWVAWDDVEGKELHRYFTVGPQPRVFDRGNALELLNFVLAQHIFPEIGIYRRSELIEIVAPTTPEASYHAYLYRWLLHGKVMFSAHAFYYECRVVKPELKRSYWSNVENEKQSADAIRANIELFVLNILSMAGRHPLEAEKLLAHEEVTRFVMRRLHFLRMKAQAMGKWGLVLELDNRLRLWFPEMSLPLEKESSDQVGYGDALILATCEAAIRLKDKIPGCTGIVVDQSLTIVGAAIGAVEQNNGFAIADLDDPGLATGNRLLIARDRVQVESLVRRGVDRAQTYSYADGMNALKVAGYQLKLV